MTITWLLAMLMGDNKINDEKKCRKIAGNFDHHGDVMVQSRVHHPIEHINGFTRSHWIPPSGECLPHITLAATMFGNFGGKHKSLTETTFS
jgi:hypothetical protein